MSHIVSQTSFFLGAITAISVAYFYLPWYLNHVKTLTLVKESADDRSIRPEPRQVAEDSLSLKTIEELYDGPSYEIKSCAITLVAHRLIDSPQAMSKLLADLEHSAHHRRERAINSLSVLLGPTVFDNGDDISKLVVEPVFTSITKALINLLPQHDKLPPSDPTWTASPVKPPRRPAHEAALLNLLIILLDNSHVQESTSVDDIIVRSGLVQDWLARYPFPCSFLTSYKHNFKRDDVVKLLHRSSYGTDDLLMATLMKHLLRFDNVIHELTLAGLRSSSRSADPWARRNSYDDGDDHAEQLWDLEATEISITQPAQPRVRDDQDMPFEERERRRQHRHAVVVAGAGEPLGPANILQQLGTDRDPVEGQGDQDAEMTETID